MSDEREGARIKLALESLHGEKPAPEFKDLWPTQRPERRAQRGATLLASAGLVACAAFVWMLAPARVEEGLGSSDDGIVLAMQDDPGTAFELSSYAYQGPTDFLLALPGQTVLQGYPSMKALDIDNDRADSTSAWRL